MFVVITRIMLYLRFIAVYNSQLLPHTFCSDLSHSMFQIVSFSTPEPKDKLEESTNYTILRFLTTFTDKSSKTQFDYTIRCRIQNSFNIGEPENPMLSEPNIAVAKDPVVEMSYVLVKHARERLITLQLYKSAFLDQPITFKFTRAGSNL